MDSYSGDEFTKLELGYSTKNIPIGSRRQVKSIIIEKTSKFIRNMQWKAWNYLHPGSNSKETYGFRTANTPPQVNELKDFETRLINLIQGVNFKDSSGKKSQFQV